MLVVYRKIEQFGLLVIIFLVFFIEPVNTLLTTVVVSTLEVLTTIFGLSGVVASVA